MSGAKYSPDEIEKKRLLALRRKAEKESRDKIENSKPWSVGVSRNGEDRSSFGLFGGRGAASALAGTSVNRSKHRLKGGSPGAMRTARQKHRLSPLKAQNFFGSTQDVSGTCSMISENRFIVDVDYHQQLIEVFKNIPSKLYDQKTRRWNFHIADYDKLITECMKLKPHVVIASIPRNVLQIFRSNLTKKTEPAPVDLSSIDSKLREMLMPFQREGICFGISKKGRCFIADDMGLGKTVQALGLAHYYRDDWPLLIVAPSSVRYQWSEAIFNFLPSVPTQCVQQFTSGTDFVGSEKVTIVSYDLLVRSIELFERHNYGFVILDESHCVKSGKTARTKAVQRIVAHARRVVLLSGTPALSRPMELYSQISLVLPSFMGFLDYGVRYCGGTKKSFGWDFSGSSNMQELQFLLKASCLIRRLKADVLKQLPAKIRQVVILDPTLIKKRSKGSKEIAKKLNSSELNKAERHSAILQYYNESSDQRIKAVCNYVSDLLESGQKFLIYAHHQNVLEGIVETLVANDIRFIRIDGKTQSDQRKRQVDLFQESSTCLVAVLSITAANAGITLTAAQLVVFAELFWNPGILCQAEDRVHRIGQASSVVIQYLVAKETADDYMWPLIQTKINVLTKAGLDQNFCLNSADVSEQKVFDEPATSPEKGQTNLDSFVTVRSSQSSGDLTPNAKSETPDTQTDAQISVEQTDAQISVEQTDAQISVEQTDARATENFDHLLDLDDVNFEDIDLENFA